MLPLLAIPKHVAIIMDGNGRWAKKNRFATRISGHRQGAQRIRSIVDHAIKIGIQELTIYTFSSENWLRPKDEVNALMNLVVQMVRAYMIKLLSEGVKLCFVGRRDRLSGRVLSLIEEVESHQLSSYRIKLNLALDYGSRDEITRVSKGLMKQVLSGDLSLEDITELAFSKAIHDLGCSDVDLLIRTAGEQRLSNFLLWQVSYAELYFTDTLFPDFDEMSLDQAIDWYQMRLRKFGKTEEQMQKETL